jgi:hypothetical protein
MTLALVKRHGLFVAKQGDDTIGQARSLELLLANISPVHLPSEYYLHAAEVLDPLIREQSGQVVG